MSRALHCDVRFYANVRVRASYPLQLLRERMMTRGLLGLVSL